MKASIFVSMQRILILQGLERDPGRSLSAEMLQRLLRAYGQSLSLVDVVSMLRELEVRGLVRLEQLREDTRSDHLYIATITRAGIDVALGFSRVEGIDPPIEE